jgi:hypothetical protein
MARRTRASRACSVDNNNNVKEIFYKLAIRRCSLAHPPAVAVTKGPRKQQAQQRKPQHYFPFSSLGTNTTRQEYEKVNPIDVAQSCVSCGEFWREKEN